MDEHIKSVIKYIHYTLEHYPTPEDLEWSTEQIEALLSHIEELEEQVLYEQTRNANIAKILTCLFIFSDNKRYTE